MNFTPEHCPWKGDSKYRIDLLRSAFTFIFWMIFGWPFSSYFLFFSCLGREYYLGRQCNFLVSIQVRRRNRCDSAFSSHGLCLRQGAYLLTQPILKEHFLRCKFASQIELLSFLFCARVWTSDFLILFSYILTSDFWTYLFYSARSVSDGQTLSPGLCIFTGGASSFWAGM